MSDPLQFEAFMRDYQNMVFTTAWRLLADQTEAEDISQEVFLKAYEHFEELKDSGTAGGWLKTVTRNMCLSHITRRRSRWRLFSDMERSDGEGERDFASEIPAPDTHTEEIEASDRREILSAALDKLPPTQRVPLVLYHFHELSYEEIALQLKVSLAKVKTDIHRGREVLRRRLSLNPEAAIG